MKSSKPSAPHRPPSVESRWGRWRRLALIGLMGCSLLGTVALVRAVMNPDRYSLFLHAGTQLEAAAAEGWDGVTGPLRPGFPS